MVQQRTTRKTPPLELPNLQIPGGADNATKYLISAVLAAGSDGCNCHACQLLKKFGSGMAEAMLKEDDSGGA